MDVPPSADPIDGTRRSAGLAARLRRHPVRTGIGAGVLVGLVAVVLVWFEPQALLYDTVVDEDFPTVEPVTADESTRAATQPGDAAATNEPRVGTASVGDDAEDADAPDTTDAPDTDMTTDTETDRTADASPSEEQRSDPVALAAGAFSSRNRYTVSGNAVVYELPGGSRTLRLEEFTSTNGPDLYVYLAAGDSTDDDATLDADTIDLGVLKGNVGAQNYAIPDDVDLTHHDTVVIWCLRFTVGFGAADLAPVLVR